jgi:hypothetical protein
LNALGWFLFGVLVGMGLWAQVETVLRHRRVLRHATETHELRKKAEETNARLEAILQAVPANNTKLRNLLTGKESWDG